MTLSEELEWRGFVNQTTLKDITELDGEPFKFYWGVDPSAKSMHVGQLAMSLMIRHFITHGHKPILLVGGATGLIGDPDGRDDERELKSIEEIEINKTGILSQYKNLFDGLDIPLVDNNDWFKDIGYLEFLRDIGKHVPMSQMLGREFVKERLSKDGKGISYAEFSYVLIQGYDFLHLYRQEGVTLQVAGSDQWGNSIAGVELIRKLEHKEAHVWTAPLIIDKTTGKKFGKSLGGAIWLDPEMTSPYHFYQFWLNVDDQSVEDYLKIYTFLSKQEIENIMTNFNKDRSARLAQKILAFDVTKLVHGVNRAESVKKISEVLFGERDYSELNADDYKELSKEIGLINTDKQENELVDLLVQSELASSKGEARRFVQAGAVYINNQPVNTTQTIINISDVGPDGFFILRRGKNTQTVVQIN